MKLGLSDEAFIRGKVPMTKQEIRILTLVKAQIEDDDIIYDIGAGTGSLSIEAARLAPAGHVYAIERKKRQSRSLRRTARTSACGTSPSSKRRRRRGLRHCRLLTSS